MVGALAIVVYLGLTLWVWATYGIPAGLTVAVAGFIALNLLGPKLDHYLAGSSQANAESTYDRKLQTLMAQRSGPGGLPGDLAFLSACALLPPQGTLLARFDRLTRENRGYLRQVRTVANRSPHWHLPIPPETTDQLEEDSLRRLDEYRTLGEVHDDPYLQDWVDRVLATYSTWYED